MAGFFVFDDRGGLYFPCNFVKMKNMNWICPQCKRSFKRQNQPHSCVITAVETHFENRPAALWTTYQALINEIQTFGPVSVSSVKHAIVLKHIASFAAIKVKKDHLLIEFQLAEKINEFPVYKTVDVSAHRFAHFVKIQSTSEIDSQLINWLKAAYDIMA